MIRIRLTSANPFLAPGIYPVSTESGQRAGWMICMSWDSYWILWRDIES